MNCVSSATEEMTTSLTDAVQEFMGRLECVLREEKEEIDLIQEETEEKEKEISEEKERTRKAKDEIGKLTENERVD